MRKIATLHQKRQQHVLMKLTDIRSGYAHMLELETLFNRALILEWM